MTSSPGLHRGSGGRGVGGGAGAPRRQVQPAAGCMCSLPRMRARPAPSAGAAAAGSRPHALLPHTQPRPPPQKAFLQSWMPQLSSSWRHSLVAGSHTTDPNSWRRGETLTVQLHAPAPLSPLRADGAVCRSTRCPRPSSHLSLWPVVLLAPRHHLALLCQAGVDHDCAGGPRRRPCAPAARRHKGAAAASAGAALAQPPPVRASRSRALGLQGGRGAQTAIGKRARQLHVQQELAAAAALGRCGPATQPSCGAPSRTADGSSTLGAARWGCRAPQRAAQVASSSTAARSRALVPISGAQTRRIGRRCRPPMRGMSHATLAPRA